MGKAVLPLCEVAALLPSIPSVLGFLRCVVKVAGDGQWPACAVGRVALGHEVDSSANDSRLVDVRRTLAAVAWLGEYALHNTGRRSALLLS